MSEDEVSDVLGDEDRRQELEDILQGWYNAGPDEGPVNERDLSGARRVAQLLNLQQASLKREAGLTALTFLQMYGSTIHLGWFGGFIGVPCGACCDTYLYRAAFYKPPAEVRNSVAYRIPGLS